MTQAEDFHSINIANSVFNAFLSSTAIMLNVTCYNSCHKKNLVVTKALKTLILSLAVTDLSVGVVAQSLYVVFLLMKLEPNAENNPFDTTVNIAVSIVITLISYVSVFSVVALSGVTDSWLLIST